MSLYTRLLKRILAGTKAHVLAPVKIGPLKPQEKPLPRSLDDELSVYLGPMPMDTVPALFTLGLRYLEITVDNASLVDFERVINIIPKDTYVALSVDYINFGPKRPFWSSSLTLYELTLPNEPTYFECLHNLFGHSGLTMLNVSETEYSSDDDSEEEAPPTVNVSLFKGVQRSKCNHSFIPNIRNGADLTHLYEVDLEGYGDWQATIKTSFQSYRLRDPARQ